MKRIGFFVDVSNLYHCVQKHFRGRRLDYRHYYDFVKDFGDITQAIAYGADVDGGAEKFKQVLTNIGFTPNYKEVKEGDNEKLKANWNVGISMDIALLEPELDLIVLGSADGDLAPAVAHCRDRGKDVIVLACGISRDLKALATECIEIPGSLVEPFHRKKNHEANSPKRS